MVYNGKVSTTLDDHIFFVVVFVCFYHSSCKIEQNTTRLWHQSATTTSWAPGSRIWSREAHILWLCWFLLSCLVSFSLLKNMQVGGLLFCIKIFTNFQKYFLDVRSLWLLQSAGTDRRLLLLMFNKHPVHMIRISIHTKHYTNLFMSEVFILQRA